MPDLNKSETKMPESQSSEPGAATPDRLPALYLATARRRCLTMSPGRSSWRPGPGRFRDQRRF